MNQTLFYSRFYYLLFAVAAISLPFTASLFYFITPLLLIIWIIEGGWKNKWNRLKESQTLFITCCFIFFWLMNVIGLFYSDDATRGLLRTNEKLPFLVFPLVFFTLNKNYFTPKKIILLLKGFIFATVIMLVISWGNAFVQFFCTGKTYYFYYLQFSKYFGHPSYCSLKVCVAFFMALYLIFHSKKTTTYFSFSGFHKWLWITMLCFFAVSIFFLQSKTGIVAFIFVSIISLFNILKIQKKSFLYGAVGIIAILVLTMIVINLFPNRMRHHVKEMGQAKNILGLRSDIWSTTYQLAMENKILGIGTGYKPDNYEEIKPLQKHNVHHSFINAHNQFLQSFLEHGIIGFSILVLLIVYSFYFAIKTRNFLLLLLLIIFGINLFFESMFERTQGIAPFIFFYCLFVIKNNTFATDSVKNNINLYE